MSLKDSVPRNPNAKPKPAPERPAAPRLHVVQPGNGWAATALHGEVERVLTAAPGTRNHTLNRAAFSLGQIVAGRGLAEADVVEALTAAATKAGLDPHEIPPTIASGLTSGKAEPRAVPDRPDYPTVTGWTPPEPDPGAIEDFWAARPVLDHIRTFARARRACPWAVLGVVLARVIVATPRWVVLPPLVGDDASLNLFISLVAPSGGGKGASEACAGAAVDVGHVDSAGVGSGEGIAHLFLRREHGGVHQHREAVLMQVTEIDTLAALGDRRGATLLPELRKAWSGEKLGFAYADPTKALPLEAHSYRLCMVAGVQPGRAQWVLDDAAGGTPQRFLWLPAVDPDAPDQAPPCPAPWTWAAPTWPMADTFTGRTALPVCDTARRTVDEARLARLRGDGDALDGHALLTRLKAAAALAILDGRAEVGDEDWALSETIAGLSERTRTRIVDHLRQEATERNRGRAEAEAQRAITVEDRKETEAVKRTCQHVLRWLDGISDGLTSSEIRRRLKPANRAVLDAALASLEGSGQVVSEATGQRLEGVRWKRT